MLFIGAIIGLVAGAVQAAAGAAISTGLSAVGLGGRLAYGTYLNTVRAIVLLGRGAGAAGAAGGGLGGFGGGGFSGGGASGSWGGDTASNNQTPTPTPTNQAQTPNELPSSGASGTQITSGNDFMEGEYDPLVITGNRGNNTNWNNLGGIGTGIASGVHLMPQVDIIYPKSTNAGKILNTGRVLQTAISPNPAWMQGGHLIPRPGVINTLPQDAIMGGIQASGQIRVEDEPLTWEEIEQLFKENLDAFLDKLREVRKVFADVAPYMVMAFSPGFAPYGLPGLMLIPEARRRFVKLIEVVNQLHEDPLTEMMLAMLGMYPAFGDIVDLVNGLLDLTKGKVGSALLSFASAVPVVGNATAITRIGAVAKKVAAGRKLLKSAARLRKRAWNLYKSKFSSKARKHIFGGDINKYGEASGVHHISAIKTKTARIVPGSKQMGSKGVYKAKVKVKDASGNFIPKEANDGYSSFFPDAWDEERTLEEIAYAFGNKQLIGSNSNLFKGFSTEGIEIHIFTDKAGNIISAFPHFPNTP